MLNKVNAIILIILIIQIIYLYTLYSKKTNLFIASDKKLWFESGTYYPMVPYYGNDCSPFHNLYCDGGCLHKYDIWMKNKFKRKTNAQRFEYVPFFNWIKDQQHGYYIPHDKIISTDFERTTGIDINNNKVISRNKEFRFKNSNNEIQVLDTYWWGSCELSARANLFFREPRKVVYDSGVKFTPHDIKGLLTLISKECETDYEKIFHRNSSTSNYIIKKNDDKIEGKILNLKIKNLDQKNIKKNGDNYLIKNIPYDITILIEDKEVVIKKEDIKFVLHETRNDVNALIFHNTIINWLKDGPFVLDIDKRNEVWNYCFGTAKIKEITPNNKKLKQFKNDLQKNNNFWRIRFFETTLYSSDQKNLTYIYWIAQNITFKNIDSGWVTKNKPDFLWRCKLKKNWNTITKNERNPYVIPKFVSYLYNKSIN